MGTLHMVLMNNVTSNKRILKNTIFLYSRMMVLMFVSFYTSRIVLNALGAENYGTYNVVGGIVTMFSFINGSMSLATNRYLSYAIGKQDNLLLQRTFNVSVIIHIFIAVIIFILGETIGLWYFYNYIKIPKDSFDIAMWVYQLSIITTMMSIINVPYIALVTAHEDMGVYAYLSLAEAGMKLGVAFLLTISVFSSIKWYAIFSFFIAIFVFSFWRIIDAKKYPCCKFKRVFDRHLLKEMFKFISWQVLVSLSWALRNQGGALVLNYFFGPILNTARTLSVQVNGGVSSLVTNFQMASNPQLVKHFSQNDIDSLQKLLFRSSKISFIFTFILAFPIIWEVEPILKFWLHNIPPYTISFVRLTLIATITSSFSGMLSQTVMATGKIREYTKVITSIMLSYIVWVYLFFVLGFPPQTMIYVEIILYLCTFISQILFCKKLYHLKVRSFLTEVTLREVFVALFSFCTIFVLTKYVSINIGFIGNSLVYFIICIFYSWIIGLSSYERTWAKSLIFSKIKLRV